MEVYLINMNYQYSLKNNIESLPVLMIYDFPLWEGLVMTYFPKEFMVHLQIPL